MSQPPRCVLIGRVLIGRVLTSVVLLCGALLSQPSVAQPSVAHPSGQTWLGARLSYAYLRHSRSLAFVHLAKPGLRLQVLHAGGEHWQVGGAVSSLLTTDKNYRVVSAQVRGRLHQQWQGFNWGLNLGVGPSYNARILHESLNSDGGIGLLGVFGADVQLPIAKTVAWGLEVEIEQLATFHAGVLLKFAL